MSDVTTTVTDNTVVTATDSVAVDGTESEQDYSLDDLLALSAEEYQEFNDDAQHKGMQPLSHWMKHVPGDVRKHLANIRADYTKKTQSLAEERNQLRAELDRERQALATERASLYNGDMAKSVRALSADETEYDIFDTDGMRAEIKRQAATMLNQMLQPAQEQLQVEQRKVELTRFATEHPDLKSDEYRMPIAQLLQERPELKLEDAYYIVKAKVDASVASTDRAALEEQRLRQKAAFSKTSSGSAQSPSGTPKFNNAWEAFNFHKSNQSKK